MLKISIGDKGISLPFADVTYTYVSLELMVDSMPAGELTCTGHELEEV